MPTCERANYFWCSDVEQALRALGADRGVSVWHVVHDPMHPTSRVGQSAVADHDLLGGISNAFGLLSRAAVHLSTTHSDDGFRKSIWNALMGAYGGVLVELRNGELGDVEAAGTVRTVFANNPVAVVGATPRFRQAVKDHVSEPEAWLRHWERCSVDLTVARTGGGHPLPAALAR